MGSKQVAAAFLAAIALATTWVTAATRVPAHATFHDTVIVDPVTGVIVAGSDRIRSDTFGPYQDGVNCVIAWVQGNFFFLRTYSSACFQAESPPVRKITLDFSDAVSRTPDGSGTLGPCFVNDAYGQTGELDLCGSNLVADVRVIANSLFAKTVTSGTPVSLPFSLSPDFSNTGFSLEFEQNVQVFTDSTNTNAREMQAASTAVAELYKNGAGPRGNGKVSLGRYRMPFRLRVEKLS